MSMTLDEKKEALETLNGIVEMTKIVDTIVDNPTRTVLVAQVGRKAHEVGISDNTTIGEVISAYQSDVGMVSGRGYVPATDPTIVPQDSKFLILIPVPKLSLEE